MGEVVLDDDDPAVGKAGAQFEMKVRVRNGTDDGDGIDLFRLRAGELEAGGDGVLRHFIEAAPMGAAPDEFRLFDGGSEFAVLEYCGGGIAEKSTDSEDDHFGCLPRFSILAKVSLSVTVRLKTGFPGVESGSTQKYPRRSNW